MVMGMVVVVVNCNIDGDYVKCDSSSGVGAATWIVALVTTIGGDGGVLIGANVVAVIIKS